MRQKIYKLCRVAGGATGMMTRLTEQSPEYIALDCVVTDDMADVAIAAGLRKPRTAGDLAKLTGKTLDEAKKLADQCAYVGVFNSWKDDKTGEQIYQMGIFAPGILENMVGNKEQLAKYPQIGVAFNAYTSNMGASLGAMIPDASSLMRVIPIESAIKDVPGAEPYEFISHYLDKYDVFSVSNCSCREARRIGGEGCGHLETDMCLHMGKPGEFYAETGKAHYITKEEAKQLLIRAEQNGLMHSIPNLDGPGETSAICNCCRCACFGLRVGLMFGARDAIRSNYVAEIDESKCVACGQCVEACPGQALKLGQKLCTKTPLPNDAGYKKMRDSVLWSKKDWDVNYRENRKDTLDSGTAPCKVACPAHIAVQGYLKLAAQGRYQDALALIKKENPLPAVCGRICNHVCETECTRGTVDQAVAIDDVKRFIADHDLDEATRYVPPMINQIGRPYDEKIAIIGSGPAGLTAAFFLAEKGYRPTVFEKEEKVGGMLMNGIPSFRLEKDVVQAEIDIIKEMGAEFKTGVEVGKDITIPELRAQGYKGFYIAIGAQGGRKTGVPGEDSEGVVTGVDFLRDVNLGKEIHLSGDTVVVGGGNVAVDVARTAVRVSNPDDTIKMYCLESRDIMPAAADEVEEAESEGVQVNCGWGPKKILVENGSVVGVVFKKCTQVKDASGKFNPQYNEAETITVPCVNVLLSIGQSILPGGLFEGTKVKFNRNGTVKADAFTYQTDEPDIFVGGDVLTGPKFAIDAIAAGKEAAISLHRIVHPGQTLTAGRDPKFYRSLDKDNVVITDYDSGLRQVPGYNKEREKTFRDSRITFTEDQVKKEAARCLGCGATKVDEYLCIGCGLCTTRCEFDAIHLRKQYNKAARKYEMLPFKVAEHVVKHVSTTAARNVAHAVSGATGDKSSK